MFQILFSLLISFNVFAEEPIGCPAKKDFKTIEWKPDWKELKQLKLSEFANTKKLKFLSGQPDKSAAYFWKEDPQDKKTYLNRTDAGKFFFYPPLDFKTCHAFELESFTKLVCGHLTNPLAILIYIYGKPMFISYEEHTSPIIEIHSKYIHNDDVAYSATVRFQSSTTEYFLIKRKSQVEVQACSTESDNSSCLE